MRTPSLLAAALLAACAAALTLCGGASHAVATSADAVAGWNVWLCRPGQMPDWCNTEMDVTAIDAKGKRRIVRAPAAPERPVDCFYLYPSLPGNTTNMKIDEVEQQIAIIQAARFGLACRVFAPMYRQSPGATAYDDARTAWHDYLARFNKGRGVVLIGHSQGAFILERLIRDEIEGSPARRKLIVSALLLGGSVSVAKGSDTGGTFRRMPACRSATQTGCVVAYSAWGRTPPPDASFVQVRDPSTQMLCVNPASPGGGSAPVTPVFPWFAPEGIVTTNLNVRTLWISFPGKYTARCVRQGTRAWLLVRDVGGAGDVRETAKEILAPGWGLHAADVNIALEQLVALVRTQGEAWIARR